MEWAWDDCNLTQPTQQCAEFTINYHQYSEYHAQAIGLAVKSGDRVSNNTCTISCHFMFGQNIDVEQITFVLPIGKQL